jgi:hypothetical protein
VRHCEKDHHVCEKDHHPPHRVPALSGSCEKDHHGAGRRHVSADWYGLDGQPIDIDEAERLLASPGARMVARTLITTTWGRIEVSTVFLVLDHGWSGGPPVLWESMTFGGPDDLSQRRYTSRAAAVAGHADLVTVCRAALELAGVDVVAVEHVGAGVDTQQPR